MEPRDFGASIRSHVDRELTLHEPLAYDFFEIRAGEESLARLEDPRFNGVTRGATRDGQWTFTRLRGGSSEATVGSFVAARYRSALRPGGTIELADEARFRLRRRGARWRLTRARREPVLIVDLSHTPRHVAFGEAARATSELPLLTLLAVHAILVEGSLPTIAGAGGTGYAG